MLEREERLKAFRQAKKMAVKMNKLYFDMMKESRSAAPIAHFSVSVRERLEKYPKKVRTYIVTHMECRFAPRLSLLPPLPLWNGAPLFHACKKGKLEMVEYLISMCGADPDQKGWHGKSKQMVPPLWCATVSGELPVVKCLISHGCQVDALSDNGMTSLEAACFKESADLDIMEYLLEHGADVNRVFSDGRTCLMAAVMRRNIELCRILLQYGADVNITDREGKTALHHAIKLQKLDTVELLLENKADPHMRTKRGDDALQAAVLDGDEATVLALRKHTLYPPERLANMYELWGSRLSLENRYEYMILIRWREAMEIRNSNMVDGNPLAKKPSEENLDDDAMEKRLCYGNASEFTSLAELDALTGNRQAIGIQCMLIRERVLGKRHEQTLSSIMQLCNYASSLIHDDSFRSVSLHQKMHLSIRALEIWDASSERSFKTACRIAGYTIELDRELRVAGNGVSETEELRFANVVSIFKWLTSILSMAWTSQKNPLLENKYRDEYRDCYARMVTYITGVMYWLIITARTSEDEYEAREHVRCLIEVNPKSIPENNTLLHVSVLTSEWIKGIDPEWENRSLQVIKLMLECGARVNARNAKCETPLHKASSSISFDPLNKLLVEHGAHLDTPDASGSTPACKISADPRNTIDVGSHMTLRCHAARVIARHEIPCNFLPASVQEFIDLHRRKKEVE